LSQTIHGKLPVPYIPQSVFAAQDRSPEPLITDGSAESLARLFAGRRHALLIARSGTGKSVFLHHLQQQVATRFRRGERVPVPILIDLRTNVLSGRKVQELIRDALNGGGVELADADVDFLLRKGGFLIMFDSLNELPNPTDAQQFHSFLHQNARNRVLIASQVDLIRRDDLRILNLAELTAEQAAEYFNTSSKGNVHWEDLAPEAQVLARNPQDLTLLTEVANDLKNASHVPTHRAELYREILIHDGALQVWVNSRDPLLSTIYGVAFRMVSERRVLQEDQLRDWIAAEHSDSGDAVNRVVQAMQSSRMFRKETERDVLGKPREVIGFRHELIGRFLAARYLHRAICTVAAQPAVDYIALASNELWLDVFYFVIDEIDSPFILNRFLGEMLDASGRARVRIAAYAIGTKPAEFLTEDLRRRYDTAKLTEDLLLTPAATVTS
jgi:hypothetical protein